MSLNENIKKLREEKGLTQLELANLVGVSQPMIAQYEMGIKVPTLIIGIKLADRLGTTCHELVAGR